MKGEIHLNTKEQLLHQAVIMFVERGYDNTSINDITKACNITKGAFYHHFKNKDEIFTDAMLVIIEEIKKWIDEKITSSKNIEELIKNLFDYSDYFSYSKYYDNINSDTYLVLINSIKKFPEFKAKVSDYIFSNIPLVEEKLKEAQRKGEINKNIDSNSFALHISVLVEGLMFVSAITGTESSLINNGLKIANNLWSMIKTDAG
jgi:AcrR family transcriptional regulator